MLGRGRGAAPAYRLPGDIIVSLQTVEAPCFRQSVDVCFGQTLATMRYGQAADITYAQTVDAPTFRVTYEG